ncbi:MAG TPA: DUF1653 domain-containing protein [Candidatus Saccharimonadales bacterium]|nr:DUF1653 domain-containing protein [Candidatus Saccharimonadales bacterium]
MSEEYAGTKGRWQVDRKRLETFGVRPGVYQHFKGGEYLTLTAGHRMAQQGSAESVGEKMVIYVALFDSPDYGPNAVWDRSVEGFLEEIEVDGERRPRFRFVREEP